MDVTLNVQASFPAGTTVKAYPESNWPAGKLPPSGAPLGSKTAEATVAASGDIALTGLTTGQTYWATAEVAGGWRYVRLVAAAAPLSTASLAASKVDKPEVPAAYTQTFSTAARTHAKAELPTVLEATLVAEVEAQLKATNEAVNELKKLVNGLIDDLQAAKLLG